MIIGKQAIIEDGAQIADDVEIGHNAIIGKNVIIESGTKIGAGAIIEGWTKIGKNCQIYQYVVIGTPPQDTKYSNEVSFIEIGDNNIIREFSTIHRATGEGNKTIIENNNFFMSYSHVAHNCIVGNKVTLINGATLGGHVIVEDHAVISAFTPIHQFCRVGKMVMLGAVSKITKDVPPFTMGNGNPLEIYGLNTRGLERNNVHPKTRENLKKVYKIFFRSSLTTEEALKKIEEEIPSDSEVKHFVEFVRSSKIGVYR